MKKTKKALLAALACSAVLAGAFGLAACGGNDDSGDSGDTPHNHNYTYTPNNDGTHDGECANTDGKCDALTVVDEECDTDGADGACSKCLVKAEADDPTTIKLGKKTIASLDEVGTTLTCVGLEAGKTYTVSCDDTAVLFMVGMEWDANPATFEYGLMANTISVYTSGATLTNVRIKLVEAEDDGGNGGDEVPVEYTDIEFDTDVTVSGANFTTPKYYRITLEEGKYQIFIDEVAANPYMDGVAIGKSFTEDGYLLPEQCDELNAYELAAGTYYVESAANVTFKVAEAAEHTHEFGEEWIGGADGHWHVTDCIYHDGEKSEILEHAYGDASAADEDGITTKTCTVCGYVYSDLSGLTATSITGGLPDGRGGYSTTDVATGTYKTTVKGLAGYGGYNPGDYYFKITCGAEAKTYTIKVLTTNTKITDSRAETLADEAGDSHEIYLRANQSFDFCVTTLDESCEADYSCSVAFKIIESEAPDEGNKEMPVIVTAGENTKTVEANQSVYYEIQNAQDGALAGDLKVTFGADVTVKYLGADIDAEGEALTSGGIIFDSSYEYNSVYLCVTSTSTEIAFNIESTIAEGKKGNPIVAEIGGAENTVTIDTDNGIYEQWYKVTAEEAGKLIVKANSSGANFEVYESVEDLMWISYGSAVLLDLTAGKTVYIKASHNASESFTFTITAPVEEDKGLVAGWEKEITEAGDYVLVSDKSYYTFTATENCTVVISYEYVADDFNPDTVYMNTDDYSFYSIDGVMTINATAGETYLIEVLKAQGATKNKVTVTITPAAAEEA